MKTLIFDFKTKTVSVAGTPAGDRALAEFIAAQQKIVTTSQSISWRPQIS